MACPSLTHKLFQIIRLEHEKILEALEAWTHLETDEARKVMADWLWNYVEVRHHAQEERMIFHKIYSHPKINEGGPLCMLYFDFHMADNPLERARKITKSSPVLESHHLIFYEVSSPVRIPLEEHRGGKEVLRHLLSEWTSLSEAEKKTSIDTYKDIQTQHIAKEETCFFHLCIRLLSEKELDDLAHAWIASEGAS